MSKQEQIRQLLNDNEKARDWGHKKIASEVGCDEGLVRRTRRVWEAERATASLAQTTDSDLAETILAKVLQAGLTEDVIASVIEEVTEELKDLKGRLKNAAVVRSRAFREAQESFPLWERHVKTTYEDASPAGPAGQDVKSPQLAEVG